MLVSINNIYILIAMCINLLIPRKSGKNEKFQGVVLSISVAIIS